MPGLMILLSSILTLMLLVSPPANARAEDLWTAWVDRNQEENQIIIAHFNGETWTREYYPYNSQFDQCFTPCPGIDNTGRLWLVWAANQSERNPGLYWSLRKENQWTEPRRVVPGSNAWEYGPAITFDPEGNPRLAWAQVSGESTEIFSSIREGDGFATPEIVSSPDGTPDSNPAVAFGKYGEAVIVWQGVNNSYACVFESRLVNGEWTTEKPVDPEIGIDQVRPAIRFETGDSPAICWEQKNRRVRFTRTKNGKVSLRSATLIRFNEFGGPDSLHNIWMLRKTPEGEWLPYRIQPQPGEPDRNPKETEFGATAASEYYVGYGDSITYGHDSGGDTSRWYGSLLKSMLESARPGLTCSFFNRGYPGAYTGEMLYGGGAWGCPGINSILSDCSWATYILIMGGTNDIGSAIPPSTITANLGEMINRTNNTNIEPVLSTIIPRIDKTSNFTRSTNLSIDYIPPLATNKNCLLADPFSIFMQYYPSDYFYENLYGYPTGNWDGTHPYWQDGDDKIAEAWFSALATPTPTPPIFIIDSDDYNGDGTSDISIFRSSIGLWAIRNITRVYFGTEEDIPIPADYNNDGTTNIGIFRPDSGLWAIRGITRLYYGNSDDVPIPGDYSGSGSCQVGIFRESTGLWAIKDISRVYFGTDGDRPVPGYYSGGRAKNIAVFRPGNGLWAIRNVSRIYYGAGNDTPAPAAYAGGGHWRPTIFRSNNGFWAIRDFSRLYFGAAGDTATPGDFDGEGRDEVSIFRSTTGLWAIRTETRVYFGGTGDTPLSGRVPYPITPTPSPAPTATPSPTPTATPSPTPTSTPSPTPTSTPSPTSTSTPSPTPTATPSPTPTSTPSPTPTAI
ncbi:MAG: GDSL-type esterase/lipase family protein [Candidatus Auribacterota bacterium]|nr:GDSL-type esterase/lipase family protein [Candidatus Auribacterota bacterium]